MIYLDNHATTQCDPAVVEAMLPYFTTQYGNPASNHQMGVMAELALKNAQNQIAMLLGGDANEYIFTSGATESNNLAILGAAKSYKKVGGTRRKIVTTQIEHKSVLEPIKYLKENGWEVCFLPINSEGIIELSQIDNIIKEDTLLVSVQLANSEIGTIQPITSIANLAHNCGSIMHCDVSQAVGKTVFKIEELGVDLVSISGHKIYGPKGIGALWVKSGFEKGLLPILFGGGKTNELRPGTLPIPLIVGLGKACEVMSQNFNEEFFRIRELRNYFETSLKSKIPGIKINGALQQRLNNNSNITFYGLDAEVLLANIPEVIASTVSACESGKIEPSRILIAIGLTQDEAFQTLRFGFGRYNSIMEIEIVVNLIEKVYNNMSTTIADVKFN